MVRAQYRAPFVLPFLGFSRFSKNPCYTLCAKFREFLLADVSGNFVTLRKVINHGNPRWCVSAMLDGKRTQRFFRTKSDAHAWMSSLHQDLTDQFWQGLTVQERQLIMITHQNGISSPAPSLNPRRVNDAVHAATSLRKTFPANSANNLSRRCRASLTSRVCSGMRCRSAV